MCPWSTRIRTSRAISSCVSARRFTLGVPRAEGAVGALVRAHVRHVERREDHEAAAVDRVLDVAGGGEQVAQLLRVADGHQHGHLSRLEAVQLPGLRQDVAHRRRVGARRRARACRKWTLRRFERSLRRSWCVLWGRAERPWQVRDEAWEGAAGGEREADGPPLSHDYTLVVGGGFRGPAKRKLRPTHMYNASRRRSSPQTPLWRTRTPCGPTRSNRRSPAPCLRSDRHPLDPLFSPAQRRGHRRDRESRAASAGRSSGTSSAAHSAAPSTRSTRAARTCSASAPIPRSPALPEQVDLAVICTPAPAVPGHHRRVRRRRRLGGDRHLRRLSRDGPAGPRARARGCSIARAPAACASLGPNCLGVMSPVVRAERHLRREHGAAGQRRRSSARAARSARAVLDWSHEMNVGFSHFVSIGSMMDVGWGDLIDYLGDDPRTKSIVIYMESIGDARAFLSAAREVALTKPIIVIKAGRTAAAARAAASHTGALTGSDEVLDAAFRRSGVLRVSSIAELFYMAEVLGKQPRPRGPRLSIVTNAGGAGRAGDRRADRQRRRADRALAAGRWPPLDACCRRTGATATRSTCSTMQARAVREGAGDRGGGSEQRRPARHPHPAGDDRPDADRGVAAAARRASVAKPVLASWMGGVDVAAGERILNEGRHPDVPLSRTPPRACSSLMWQLQLQPARPLRDAGAARGHRRRRAPRGRRRRASSGPRAPSGPHAADRGRVEAGAGGLRHPRRRDARGARREDEAVAMRRGTRLPGRRSSSTRRRSRTRPTWAASS